MIKVVGCGSFGIVRQCRSLLDGRVYAVKSMPFSNDSTQLDEKQRKQMQEAAILEELQHPNIIKFCGSFTGYDFGSEDESSPKRKQYQSALSKLKSDMSLRLDSPPLKSGRMASK